MGEVKSQWLSPYRLCLLRFFCVGLLSSYCGMALADEFRDFENAKNAYDVGDYKVARDRFEAILSGELSNKALTQESHKLLAVSYLFLEDKENATVHFSALLALDPDFNLESLFYPIDVIDFFTEIKNHYAEQLRVLAEANANEEAAQKRAEEKRLKLEREKLIRTVYISRDRMKRSKLLAVMPLGAGQFQNGHRIKGIVFLSIELLLAASATTTFILHEGLRPRSYKPFASTEDRQKYERLEIGYRVANQASLITLGSVALLGMVDSLFFFKHETEKWAPLNENEVPKKMRHKSPTTSIIPIVNGTIIGIGASGSF